MSWRTQTTVWAAAAIISLSPSAIDAADAKSRVDRICNATRLQSSVGRNGERLGRGEHVIVLKRRKSKIYVVSNSGQGWIAAKSLCR